MKLLHDTESKIWTGFAIFSLSHRPAWVHNYSGEITFTDPRSNLQESHQSTNQIVEETPVVPFHQISLPPDYI